MLSEHTLQCIITVLLSVKYFYCSHPIKTWGAEVHGVTESDSDQTKSYLKAPTIQKMQTSEARSICFLVLLVKFQMDLLCSAVNSVMEQYILPFIWTVKHLTPFSIYIYLYQKLFSSLKH